MLRIVMHEKVKFQQKEILKKQTNIGAERYNNQTEKFNRKVQTRASKCEDRLFDSIQSEEQKRTKHKKIKEKKRFKRFIGYQQKYQYIHHGFPLGE